MYVLIMIFLSCRSILCFICFLSCNFPQDFPLVTEVQTICKEHQQCRLDCQTFDDVGDWFTEVWTGRARSRMLQPRARLMLSHICGTYGL